MKKALTIAIVFAAVLGSVSLLNSVSAQTCDPDTLKPVKYGQRSVAVKNAQSCLIELGFDIPAGATGYYGSQTTAAAKTFYADIVDMVWPGKNIGPKGIDAMQTALADGTDEEDEDTTTGGTGGTTPTPTVDQSAQLRILLKALGLTDAQITAVLAAIGQTSTTQTTTTTTPTTVTSSGTVTVGLASDNPVAVTLPDGSIYNNVLKLSFAATGGDVAVTGLTITRTGYTANTNITGVSVWDGDTKYGLIITSLTSDGKATLAFGSAPLNVLNGQTKTLAVKINISDGAGSGTVGFNVNAVTDITVGGTAKVAGTFPLVGNLMGIVDGANSLGNIYVSAQSTVGSTDGNATSSSYSGNLDVGDTQKEVAKLRFTQNNSKEGIYLEKLTVYLSGTIEEGKDLKNWNLHSPDGTLLASTEKSVDRYVTFKLTTPYFIDKGVSKDLTVRVDVTSGSGRYFTIYMMNDYDIMARGAITNAYVLPLDSGGTAYTYTDTVNNTSGYFKMRAGSLTVAKSTASPSGNVSPSSQNVVLAKFDLTANGEKLEIRKIGVQIKYASTALNGSLTIRDAATQASYLSISADTSNLQVTTDPTAATLLTYQRDLSSYIPIESGQTKTLEIVGSVPSTATSGVTYQVNVGQFYAKRESTNDYTTLVASANLANQLTVAAVSLTVTKNASYSNFSKVAGATNVKIAEFILQASNSDNIAVSGINLTVTGTTTNLMNLKLKKSDGTQIGSTQNSNSSVTFSIAGLTINKNESLVLGVYADIAPSASTNATTTVSIAASGVSGTGVSSSVAISSTPASAVAGQIVTVAAATLTITKDADSPISKIIINGQAGVEVGKIKFEATGEDVVLKKITLATYSASSTWWTATATPANIERIYLYDGATLLNTGGTSLVSGSSTISGLTLTVPQGASKVLTVKIDSSNAANSVPLAVVNIGVFGTSTTDLEAYAPSQMSTGITLTGNASSSFMLFTNAAPAATNAWTASTAGTVSTAAPIAKYTITNSGTRDITLTRLDVALLISGATSSSSAALQSIALWDSTNEGTAIATTNVGSASSGINSATTSSSGATSTTVTFGTFTQRNVIAAGASRTYIVVANTTGLEAQMTNPGQNVATVGTYLNGAKGYLSTENNVSDLPDEIFWNDGVITYSYDGIGVNAGITFASNLASDSGVVYGPTLTY